MKLFKRLFSITPFKLSTFITLFFVGLSLTYAINPRWISWLSAFALKTADYKFEIRGPQSPKSKIIIAAADEKAFQKFGQWPFDRGTVMAPLIASLCKLDIKSVGFDLIWTDRERLMAPQVQQALQGMVGGESSLNQVLQENSGDYHIKKALEGCSNKAVMGYGLYLVEQDGLSAQDFQDRLKLVTEQGSNKLTTMTRGNITYPEYTGDPNATVLFDFVGKSGLLNIGSVVPEKASQGFLNNIPDADGNYRHAIFFGKISEKFGGGFVSSLALRMAQKTISMKDSPPQLFLQGNNPDQNLSDEIRLELNTAAGTTQVPLDLYGQAMVNYRGPNYTYPNVSIVDILNSDDTIEYTQFDPRQGLKRYRALKSEFFKGAQVIVGITAVGAYDVRPRPFDGTASGVENHATILDNLINNDFITAPTIDFISWAIPAVLVFSLLFGWAVFKLDAKWGAFFAIPTIGGFLYFDQQVLFNQRGIFFPAHLHAFQFLFQYLAITVLKYMQEENEKKFIRSAFDKYVSPAVINSMLQDPSKLKIGGDKKELSILFSDIRGFTELSERLDVKALTGFLNEYLGAMTDILQKNQGTLDKYIGDAVMGFWGAPININNHATLAVKTAVEMVIKLDELNAQFKQKYGLSIDIGIGINSGAVSVGNFGSSKVFEYTVIGDNVNLASRLEGVNKYYGTHIIISESTYAQINPNEFLCREVDTVKVKGKHKPVKIYEVFPDNKAHEPLKNVLKTFQDALKKYYDRSWNDALALFESVLKTREGDKPSLELIERCKYYLTHPPAADWDGSWEMHSK